MRFLPILGFAVRSTNIRNSFELFIPLLEISHQLLGPDTNLVLSSEWDFSPFTYPLVFAELPNFVLIGLPASESGNPLVVPLAGHELGHSVWRSYDADTRLSPVAQANVIAALEKNWATFETLYGKMDASKIQTDMFIRSVWAAALKLSMQQIQEVLCDCVGIRIFGESYFHATEYLLSPHFGNRRALEYPDIKTRTEAMVLAAQRFRVPHPANFSDRFSEGSNNLDPKEDFILKLSDLGTQASLTDTISLVDAIANHVKLPKPDDKSIEAIYLCFKSGIPAQNLSGLADVINAGWKAYFDDSLWKAGQMARERFTPLSELILKTVEVMEFEIKMREA